MPPNSMQTPSTPMSHRKPHLPPCLIANTIYPHVSSRQLKTTTISLYTVRVIAPLQYVLHARLNSFSFQVQSKTFCFLSDLFVYDPRPLHFSSHPSLHLYPPIMILQHADSLHYISFLPP